MTGRISGWWHGHWSHMITTARTGAQHARRLAAQAPEKAFQAGRKLAGKVIDIQKSAKLPEKLMHQSAEGVISRQPVSASHQEWQHGYQTKVLERTPALAALPQRREAVPADREAGS